MIRLVIRAGPQAGEVLAFPADQSIIRLGRSPANDMVLQDKQASRYHAQISRHGAGFLIRDLDSTNGTFVNDEKLKGPRPLRPGDRIRIGEVVVECEMDAAAAAAGQAALGVGRDWEASLWQDAAAGTGGGRRRLAWGLGGAVLVVALVVVGAVVLALRSPREPAPAGSLAEGTTGIGQTAEAQAVLQTAAVQTAGAGRIADVQTVAAQTVAAQEARSAQAAGAGSSTADAGQAEGATPSATPTETPLPPTVGLLPSATATATPEPTATATSTEPPATGTATAVAPTRTPATAGPGGELEALPAVVVAMFPGVSAESLPATLALALDSLAPEEVQALVAALFPGVDAEALPRVVAASFPGIPESDLAGLLEMAFPGEGVALPVAGPPEGRMALGIYDGTRQELDLYLADAATGRTERLLAQAGDPDLSVDGQLLAYHSWIPDRVGLRLMAIDGSGDRLLTSGDGDGSPAFAPDGQRIAYFNNSTGTLHVIGRDGSGCQDLGSGEYGAWSPAGDQLVYRGCVGGGACGLVVAGADGSNRRRITTHPDDTAPRWSPNGGQIAFMSDRQGNWEIYVVNADGSWLRRITTDPASDTMPVWSPDGLRLAWRSDRQGQWGVWVAAGIGGRAERLFDADPGPDWTWARLAWAQE
jgi:hypothetical protein